MRLALVFSMIMALLLSPGLTFAETATNTITIEGQNISTLQPAIFENGSIKALSSKQLSTLEVTAASGQIVITGRWRYEDDSGIHPLRNTTVKLYQKRTLLPDVQLGSNITDDDGYYSITATLNENETLYVQAEGENDAGLVTPIISTPIIPYRGNTGEKLVSPADPSTWDFGWYYFQKEYENWQALDYMLDEYRWIKSNAGYTIGPVNIMYPSEILPLGQGEWPQSAWIAILLPGNAFCENKYGYKCWGRTTVLHEYGHMVMGELYGMADFPINLLNYDYEGVRYYFWDMCPAADPNQCSDNGVHTKNSVTYPGFAVVEGWAEFMPAAVDNNPGKTVLYGLGDVDGDDLKWSWR